MDNIALTVVSFGAGQDTVYFLHRILTDPTFRAKHICGRLLVLGSDTGNEHDHTYAAIDYMSKLCTAHGVEFYWITNSMGYHPRTWQSLTHQYMRNSTIGSAAYVQTCTDNLKIKPLYNFLEDWIKANYGYDTNKKQAYHQFAQEHGKIRIILGFAKNEESRVQPKVYAVWQKASIIKYFPLILDGTDRQAAIDYNEAHIPMKIWPSNCKLCFYQSDQEILWLYRFYPSDFWLWVEMERAKISKCCAQGVVKNYGVYGKLSLVDKLHRAQRLYGHWTDEELNEYKYSHGHCIKSKY